MQETLQELQALRTEDEDIRRRLDALKGRNLYTQQRSVLTPLIQDLEHVAVTEEKEKKGRTAAIIAEWKSPLLSLDR